MFFPNDFEGLHKTNFQIAERIITSLQNEDLKCLATSIQLELDLELGGLFELVKDLTDKFENQYVGKVWLDNEYSEAFEAFIRIKLYPYSNVVIGN